MHIYRRVSFYDGVTFSEYLVVNRIVVKRILFEWFKLRKGSWAKQISQFYNLQHFFTL